MSFSFFYYLYGFFSCYSRLSGDSFKNLYDSRNQSGLLGSISHPFYIFVLLSLCVLLTSCASSDVSRDAASNVDMGVQNAKNLVSGVGNSDVADYFLQKIKKEHSTLWVSGLDKVHKGITSLEELIRVVGIET